MKKTHVEECKNTFPFKGKIKMGWISMSKTAKKSIPPNENKNG